MKNKKDLMFGILFTLLMVAFIFFIEIIYVPSISAVQTEEWRMYGNTYSPMWEQQYTGTSGYFINYTFYNRSINFGINPYTNPNPQYSRYRQVLVSSLNYSASSYQEFLVFPQGNYIEIYDKDLNLISEISAGGSCVSQLVINDLNGDGVNDDILGIFNVSGSYYFRDYQFNSSSFSWGLLGSYPLLENDVFIGIRGSSNEAYLIRGNYSTKSANFSIINFSGGNIIFTDIPLINTNNLTSSNFNMIEPLAWIDMNKDGQDDFLYYDDNTVMVFEKNGTNLFKKDYSGTTHVLDAKMIKSDSTGIWRIAVLTLSAIPTPIFTLNLYRFDGTSIWSKSYFGVTGGNSLGSMAIDNYDTDITDNEIFLYTGSGFFGTNTDGFYILKGKDGTQLKGNTSNVVAGGSSYSMFIGDMNLDGYKDFVTQRAGRLSIFDITNNLYLLNNATVNGACIPADINLDGFQEIICSSSSSTNIIFSNYTNQNAVLNSVIFNPDINVNVGTTVYAIISASDLEGDSVMYAIKCSNSDSWTESSNPAQSCYYGNVGIFNLSTAVRDIYHSNYDSILSVNLTVTQASSFCNNNGICEASLGETYYNCPNDCPLTNQTQQSTETGGIPIPTQLVDVDNIQQGLLPEIYFGTLGFLSNTLQPMIILIFMIFFVLIILAIAFIIRSIGKKVSDLS